MPLDPPQALAHSLLRGYCKRRQETSTPTTRAPVRVCRASVNPPVPQPRSKTGEEGVTRPIRIRWGIQAVRFSDE